MEEALALDAAPKCNVQISNLNMALEELRRKVLYQNSLDIWIGFCEEKKFSWKDIESYKKFIEYLQNQNLNMKQFPLCVSEADSSIEENKDKAKFAESLSEKRDPNCSTYTIKLNNSAIETIRKFNLKS